MRKLDAYLFFDRNCADAMRFYEKTLKGKLDMQTVGGSPVAAECPTAAADLIIHARLEFDGGVLMASDNLADAPHEPMQGFSLSLSFPESRTAKTMFDTLSAGGRVVMPFGKTFWSDGFGMLVDRFGTPWMVNTIEFAA
jgi:PhnB protein